MDAIEKRIYNDAMYIFINNTFFDTFVYKNIVYFCTFSQSYCAKFK